MLLLVLLVLCCRLSFVTHWGTTYFRLKCRSRSCCRCRQCAWTGLSGWTPTAGIYGGALLFLLILLLSSAGRSGLTPMKVTLCGVALSAFVSSITAAILILDEQTLLAMRTWLAGDLAGRIGRRWVRPPGFLWGICVSPLPCTLP
ncbi:iron chelate uptake ABC transporter family permease subunit [Escherichia coli]